MGSSSKKNSAVKEIQKTSVVVDAWGCVSPTHKHSASILLADHHFILGLFLIPLGSNLVLFHHCYWVAAKRTAQWRRSKRQQSNVFLLMKHCVSPTNQHISSILHADHQFMVGLFLLPLGSSNLVLFHHGSWMLEVLMWVKYLFWQRKQLKNSVTAAASNRHFVMSQWLPKI